MDIPLAEVPPLLSAEEIAARVKSLGAEISRAYAGKDDFVVIGVLKGSFLFMADLIREISLPLECDFLGLQSYGDRRETSGVVKISSDLNFPIVGRNVLVVEDIYDTGLTLNYLLENLETRKPSDIKICCLLSKPENHRIEIPIDFLGFEIPNRFVVGYGLDLAEKYRNLPYIGVLDH